MKYQQFKNWQSYQRFVVQIFINNLMFFFLFEKPGEHYDILCHGIKKINDRINNTFLVTSWSSLVYRSSVQAAYYDPDRI